MYNVILNYLWCKYWMKYVENNFWLSAVWYAYVLQTRLFCKIWTSLPRKYARQRSTLVCLDNMCIALDLHLPILFSRPLSVALTPEWNLEFGNEWRNFHLIQNLIEMKENLNTQQRPSPYAAWSSPLTHYSLLPYKERSDRKRHPASLQPRQYSQ